MSIKHFKLGWKRCHLIECTSALTVEQTEEDCGWVHWREHKDEVARLKAEVERLRKAGDACADAAYAHCMCQDCEELRDQWRDAKRGKQP